MLAGGAGVRLRVESWNRAEPRRWHGRAAGHGSRVYLRRVPQHAVKDSQAERLRLCEKAEIQPKRVDGGPLVISVLHVDVMGIGRVDTPRTGKRVHSHVQHGGRPRHSHDVLGRVDGAIERAIGQRSARTQAVVRGQKLRDEKLRSGRIQRREIAGHIRR